MNKNLSCDKDRKSWAVVLGEALEIPSLEVLVSV